MICKSHGTRNCTQPMCKQQRLREQSRAAEAAAAANGGVAPTTPASRTTSPRATSTAKSRAAAPAPVKAPKPPGMWEERTFGALPSTFRTGEPGEIWVNNVPEGGEIVGHLPGTPCLKDGVDPDATGLWDGWGRVNSPGARADLTDKKPVTTTDGTALVAARWCRNCKDLGI